MITHWQHYSWKNDKEGAGEHSSYRNTDWDNKRFHGSDPADQFISSLAAESFAVNALFHPTSR